MCTTTQLISVIWVQCVWHTKTIQNSLLMVYIMGNVNESCQKDTTHQSSLLATINSGGSKILA